MIKTYKYRLKSKNLSYLDKAASSVNFVWNYCNEVSMEYLDKHYKWLSGYDLSKLTTGCSKQLDIDARSIQIVCQEYARRRYQSKKRKLSWRSKKRSLGWIPFYKDTIKIMHDTVVHHGKVFKFWKSRDVDGEVKSERAEAKAEALKKYGYNIYED